jgi:rubrerythrin
LNNKGYCLVFEGRAVSGFDRREVIELLSRRLGRDPESIGRLFCDKPVTVRKGLDREKAFDQQEVFTRMGVCCRVEPPEAPEGNDSEDGYASSYTRCPKCGNDLTKFVTPVEECPYCGIIISKYLKKRQQSVVRA